ncbi:MAG: hypothetical protein ACTSUQ_03440 [Candidatus Freyarchaeota archaeon]
MDRVLGKQELDDFQLIKFVKQQYPDDYVEKLRKELAALETEIFSRIVEASIKLDFAATRKYGVYSMGGGG